jgi:hypothetical protein
VRERLAPDGVVMINVGHPERSSRLERVLSATLAAVFPSVMRDPSQSTNTMLVGSAGPLSAKLLAGNALRLPAQLRPVAAAAAARLAPRLTGGRVYTDDVAPVEWLVDSSIVQVAADGER